MGSATVGVAEPDAVDRAKPSMRRGGAHAGVPNRSYGPDPMPAVATVTAKAWGVRALLVLVWLLVEADCDDAGCSGVVEVFDPTGRHAGAEIDSAAGDGWAAVCAAG